MLFSTLAHYNIAARSLRVLSPLFFDVMTVERLPLFHFEYNRVSELRQSMFICPWMQSFGHLPSPAYAILSNTEFNCFMFLCILFSPLYIAFCLFELFLYLFIFVIPIADTISRVVISGYVGNSHKLFRWPMSTTEAISCMERCQSVSLLRILQTISVWDIRI